MLAYCSLIEFVYQVGPIFQTVLAASANGQVLRPIHQKKTTHIEREGPEVVLGITCKVFLGELQWRDTRCHQVDFAFRHHIIELDMTLGRPDPEGVV